MSESLQIIRNANISSDLETYTFKDESSSVSLFVLHSVNKSLTGVTWV